MGRGASRQDVNTIDERFRVVFVERHFEGPERWFKDDWIEHHRSVEGDSEDRFLREPTIRNRIRYAHDRSRVFNHSHDYLFTCMNPECESRYQEIALPSCFNPPTPSYGGNRQRLTQLLEGPAAGRLSNDFRCTTCREKLLASRCEVIEKKWIYILYEDGDDLVPYCEIDTGEQEAGTTYTRFRNGAFVDDVSQDFHGYVNLLPDPTARTWHFFLSPVRLGAEAISLLRESKQRDEEVRSARDEAGFGDAGVRLLDDFQPWVTTVVRRFSERQASQPLRELVPLVDPFSYAAQRAQLDYMPILAAQMSLVRDKDEQYKSFVASVLHQAVAERVVNEDPLEYARDEMDIAGEMISKPSELRGSSVGEAWVRRYEDAITFLTEETHRACARLAAVPRYSFGHRIIEKACQERNTELGTMSYAMMHWLVVLRDISACSPGNQLLAWLTSNGTDDGNPINPQEMIPFRTVMAGEFLTGETALAREVRTGLPTQLIAAMAPAIVARSSDRPEEDFANVLQNANIPAESFGASSIRSIGAWAVGIPDSIRDRYFERTKGLDAITTANGQSAGRNLATGFKVVSTVNDFISVATYLISLFKASQTSRYRTDWDRYSSMRDNLANPVSVAKFVTSCAQDLLKARFERQGISEIAQRAATQRASQLSTQEYQLLISSRSVRSYAMLGRVSAVLAGPIGVVLGGSELVINGGRAIDAWESSDPGRAVGHGIQAAAGLLIIAAAGAHCVALATGAAAAAWAGPIGWIAAGLMLIGALVITFFSKNDLQLFARHCFLGQSYGGGNWSETGKHWLNNLPWPALRYQSETNRTESSERWQRQCISLTRLLSTYSMLHGAWSFCGPDVRYGFLTDSMVFEVKVTSWEIGNEAATREEFTVLVWPQSRRFEWIGRRPSTGGTEQNFRWLGTPAGFRISAPPSSFRRDKLYDYNMQVRLNLDGGTANYLPASGSYVTSSSTIRTSGYRRIESTTVE